MTEQKRIAQRNLELLKKEYIYPLPKDDEECPFNGKLVVRFDLGQRQVGRRSWEIEYRTIHMKFQSIKLANKYCWQMAQTLGWNKIEPAQESGRWKVPLTYIDHIQDGHGNEYSVAKWFKHNYSKFMHDRGYEAHLYSEREKIVEYDDYE